MGRSVIDFLTQFTKDLECLEEKQSISQSIADIHTLPPYFSMVDVKSVKIKFDFASRNVDINGLKGGM